MDNPVPPQSELPFAAWYRAEQLYRENLAVIRGIVDDRGRKEVVYDVRDWREARFSHSWIDSALLDRDGKQLKARHLLYALFIDPRRVLESMAGAVGYEVRATQPLTAAQKLARIEAELAKCGDIGEQIRRRAYGG